MLKQPVPHLRSLAIVALVMGLSHAAQAQVTDVTAGSDATANGAAGTTSTDGTSPSYVNSSSFANSGLNSGSGFAFANSGGVYAVRSGADGVGTGDADARLTFSFTNTGSIGQTFTANFFLYGGGIGNSVSADPANPMSLLTAGESLISSYLATISVGGLEQYRSAATLTTTATGSTLATEGSVLNAADDGTDGFYGWNSQNLSLTLGFLDAGESIDIVAELMSSSRANVGVYSFDCGGGGYEGYGGYELIDDVPIVAFRTSNDVGGTCESTKGSTFVGYGDPLTVAGNDDGTNAPTPANQFRVTATNAVPEPGALALVGLALMGLAWQRRRPR